ncbi:hypothetical protein [Undibacterium curvum]|uniref:hypothetical protein n=1 Tax=Undibacterium curvum TaxID=2762294 RepID=UPI003D0E6A05
MSVIVNDRDVLLQAAVTRSDNPKQGKAMLMSVSSSVFKVAAGVATPAVIAINVSLVGLNGAPTIEVTGAKRLIGSAGLARTLAYDDVTADTVEVTATLQADGQTYVAKQTIVRLMDGRSGDNGQPGVSHAQMYAYKRSPAAPADRPGDVTYAFESSLITSPAGDALANGWSKTIPAGSDPLYVCVASASGTGATDTIASAEWTAPVLLVKNGQNGDAGQNGISAATVYIYQRTASAVSPALPAQPATYTFLPPGLTGLTGGWSATVPTAGGHYLHVSTATAASTDATDVIDPTEWAAVQLLAKDGESGIDGAAGISNAQVYAYKRSATAPPDRPGNVTYTFASGLITSPAGDALANGWSKTIPAGSDPLYVCVASASSDGAMDIIGTAEWSTPVVLVQNGQTGQNGLNVATVYIYRRAVTAAVLALPSVGVTYNFATGVATGIDNGWSTTIPANGGDYLYVSHATASSASSTDLIAPSEWAPVSLLSRKGDTGAPGIKSALVRAYAWSLNVAPPISGLASYTWASASYDAPPNGWSSSRPAPPARGASLYEAVVSLVDGSGGASSQIDWSTASVQVVGSTALDGQSGAQGASMVIAYCLVDGNGLNATPAYAVVTGNNLPLAGTWGESRTWQTSPPQAGANQCVMQANGIYNPVTNQTVWAAPLLASLRVGALSAISANLGHINGGSINIGGRFIVDEDGGLTMKTTTSGTHAFADHTGFGVRDNNGVIMAHLGVFEI